MALLKLLGAVRLEGPAGVLSGASTQRHRLALLALLAMSRSCTLPREKLMGLLWPERDEEHVRNLLKQSVHVLRKDLGDAAIHSTGVALQLNTDIVRCDALEFEQAMTNGNFDTAIELYTGPFLDGLFINDAHDFETWVTEQRTRMDDAHALALEEVAKLAEVRADIGSAMKYWKALVATRPHNTRAVLGLMRACELSGDPGGALRHAERHERYLRDELDMRPPAEMASMVGRLQGLRDVAADQNQTGTQSPLVPLARAESVNENLPPANPAARSSPRRMQVLLISAAIVSILMLAVTVGFRTRDSEPPVEGPAITADEVARIVALEVDRRLRGEPGSSDPTRRTVSISAYEAYVRGNEPAMFRSTERARQALGYLRQAVELDPSYAAAWASLAKISMRVAFDNSDNSDELLTRAEEAARRAIALDSSMADPHVTLGRLRMADFELPAAEHWLQRALALDPNHTLARQSLAGLHLWMGEYEQALTEAREAARLDPLSPGAAAELARALAANGRCDEALVQLDTISAVDPPLLRTPVIAAHCLERMGLWQRAIDALGDHAEISAKPDRHAMLGYLLARGGQHAAALELLDTLHQQWQQGDGSAFPIAMLHGGLGDSEQVFLWLERAVSDGSLGASPDQFTMLQPILDQLRGDPRFERLPMLAHWHGARDR